MQFKASDRLPDGSSSGARDESAPHGTRQDTSPDAGQLEPIPSGRLDIARLARGQPGAATEGRNANESAPLLSVGLHRKHLKIGHAGGYFMLKMLLVRALRRSLKTAIIEVDDAENPAAAEVLFELDLDPPDSKALGRARKVVQRVLRTRRWQSGLGR